MSKDSTKEEATQVVENQAPVGQQINIGPHSKVYIQVHWKLGGATLLAVVGILAFVMGWGLAGWILCLLSLLLLAWVILGAPGRTVAGAVGAGAATGTTEATLLSSWMFKITALLEGGIVVMALLVQADPKTYWESPVLGEVVQKIVPYRFHAWVESGAAHFVGKEQGGNRAVRQSQVWLDLQNEVVVGRYILGGYRGTLSSFEMIGPYSVQLRWENESGQRGRGEYDFDPESGELSGTWWIDGTLEPMGTSQLEWVEE